MEQATAMVKRHIIPVDIKWTDTFLGSKKSLKFDLSLFHIKVADDFVNSSSVIELTRDTFPAEQWEVNKKYHNTRRLKTKKHVI